MYELGKEPFRKNKDALILHLCPTSSWEEAKAQDVYHAPSLDSEGFIHCSRAVQILDVANAFYRDVPDLVLLWIDPRKVVAEIRWEHVGEGTFPHIYGELNLEAVVDVSELHRDGEGYFSWL
jgi:uncharacterized protein (DUF952 family)